MSCSLACFLASEVDCELHSCMPTVCWHVCVYVAFCAYATGSTCFLVLGVNGYMLLLVLILQFGLFVACLLLQTAVGGCKMN